MNLFFELEIPYIAIGIFFLIITAIVTTRSTLPKSSFKYGMSGVFGVFAVMISLHYLTTTLRMDGVKKIFNEGGTVICENKMHRTISQSVLISKGLEWKLEDDEFVSKKHFEWFVFEKKYFEESSFRFFPNVQYLSKNVFILILHEPPPPYNHIQQQIQFYSQIFVV